MEISLCMLELRAQPGRPFHIANLPPPLTTSIWT